MQDPVSNMITKIRNALTAKHTRVIVQLSKFNRAITRTLQQEGFIRDVLPNEDGRTMTVYLKYYKGKPVIEKIVRASKPSKRLYTSARNIPKYYSGFGMSILSTSKGVISDRDAKQMNIGGEVICYVF